MTDNFYGRLDILMGSMFSGKSSALIRKLSQLSGEPLFLNVLYINHAIDDRAETDYSSHSPLLKDTKLNYDTVKADDISKLIDIAKEYDVIGIDETQFFSKNVVDFVLQLVEKHNKYVIVAGLDGDFRRNKFGHLLDLIPFADNVTKLHAYCKPCAENKKTLVTALFTNYQNDTHETVIVGAGEKYQPVCRKCYLHINGGGI